MQKTSSPKKSRPSESKESPSRQSLLNAYNNQSEDAGELQHQVLELNAENEHVKNIMIGLNEKLLAFNDFKQDVENHKAMLKSSEGEREQWQIKVRTISQKVMVDSEEHTVQRESLIRENETLKRKIESMEQEKVRTHQLHLDEVSRINAAHAGQLQQLSNEIAQVNAKNSENLQALNKEQQRIDAQYKKDLQARAELMSLQD
jgi:hypothetical protein